MLSKDLLKGIKIQYKSQNYHDSIEIEYLSENTKDLQKNTCFICIEGKKYDGHQLIKQVKTKPALIIATHQINTTIPYIIVSNPLEMIPKLCANFYHQPSQHLQLIGVTGTDGKTSTSFIIKQLLEHVSECAYVGTNGFIYRDKNIHNPLTTPKPIILHKFLSQMVTDKIPCVSLEVSSQGLDLHRADELQFKVAVFTNLSHEHLDYHKTMENYFHSKSKLFQMLDENSTAVINIDNEYGKRLLDYTKAKIITYGKSSEADFQIHNITTSFKESFFDLKVKDKQYNNIQLNLFGDYNVYNATAALASCYALGYPLQELTPSLAKLQPIDGRLQFIDCGQPYPIIVDFAHTPNALNCLLRNIHQYKNNQLTIVFGSAGERDQTKRPLMGEVVENYATNIILTSEDPKSEDTLDIITDIYKGIQNVFNVSIIPNRKKAIYKALKSATKDDIVVITGKGNEKFELFDGYQVRHNDIEAVESYFK